MESFMKAVVSIADSLNRIADALEMKNQTVLPLVSAATLKEVAPDPTPTTPKVEDIPEPEPTPTTPKVEDIPEPTPAPKPGPEITLEMLKDLARDAVASGHVASVKKLLEKFKCKSVSLIDPKHIPEAYGLLKAISA